MNYSEQVLLELKEIAEDEQCGLIEAAATFCERHDLEPEEFASWIDEAAKDVLRQDALETNKVRKTVGTRVAALEFE